MSAMRGDTSSLAKDFNIPDSQIKSFNAEIISSKGNFTAFLSSMDKLRKIRDDTGSYGCHAGFAC